MSLEIAWKQNIQVKDSNLLKLLLVVFGFGSQTFVCGFSRQNICSVGPGKFGKKNQYRASNQDLEKNPKFTNLEPTPTSVSRVDSEHFWLNYQGRLYTIIINQKWWIKTSLLPLQKKRYLDKNIVKGKSLSKSQASFCDWSKLDIVNLLQKC